MAMRIDTRLESEAAEFLVLGHLLLNRISAFKAYVNFPGYDLIATNADTNSSARIQVKSRYQSDWNGFIINNFDCDFVALVALNRGYPRPRASGDKGIREPDIYVLPIDYVAQAKDHRSSWGKIQKNSLPDLESYKNRWDLIQSFLSKHRALRTRSRATR
jgi:hypothetical protein